MIFSYGANHKTDVLNSFGFTTKDGLVVDKNTGNVVNDNLGQPLTVKRFGGLRKGSIEFINKDVASLIKLRKKIRGK